jgi:hypothetical protein
MIPKLERREKNEPNTCHRRVQRLSLSRDSQSRMHPSDRGDALRADPDGVVHERAIHRVEVRGKAIDDATDWCHIEERNWQPATIHAHQPATHVSARVHSVSALDLARACLRTEPFEPTLPGAIFVPQPAQ